MILPFYRDINFQEFRKFTRDQSILSSIKIYSNISKIPAFVTETGLSDAGVITCYVVYLNSYGNEITRVALTNNEIQQKRYLSKILYFSTGPTIPVEHPYCKYYIEIQDSLLGYFYSEVITTIKEINAAGRIKLNTGGFLLLNLGGFYLLNDETGGQILEELTKITASTSRNYGNSDFAGITLDFYAPTRPYLEESYTDTVSEINAGEETVFQKVKISNYSLEFFAVGSVAENLQYLEFFDDIKIYSPENRNFEAVNRVTVKVSERVDYSGIYRVKINFQTNYKIDLQIVGQEGNTDMIQAMVGVIQFTPSQLSQANFLSAMNLILDGSGFQAVICDGITNYDPESHPYAAAILGTKNVGGIARVVIPNMKGVIAGGAGTGTDLNGDSKQLISGAVEGTYKHTLLQNEMTHLHITGGYDVTSGSRFLDYFNNEVFSPELDIDSMDEYDSKTTYFSIPDNLPANPLSLGNMTTRKVTTKNDGTAEMLAQRIGHTNMQPTLGAYCWMIIDAD